MYPLSEIGFFKEHPYHISTSETAILKAQEVVDWAVEHQQAKFALVAVYTPQPGMSSTLLCECAMQSISTLKEPGCFQFDILVSRNGEGEIVEITLYEVYENEKAFTEDHRSTEHYREFKERVAPLTLKKTSTYYERC